MDGRTRQVSHSRFHSSISRLHRSSAFQLFPGMASPAFSFLRISSLYKNCTVHLLCPRSTDCEPHRSKYVISFPPSAKNGEDIPVDQTHNYNHRSPIHPDGEIQTHLIRADLIPFRIRKQHLPVINFFLQKVQTPHHLPGQNVLALAQAAGLHSMLSHTHNFFFCSQKQRSSAVHAFQDFKSFPCNRTGNRFCSQIKNFF